MSKLEEIKKKYSNINAIPLTQKEIDREEELARFGNLLKGLYSGASMAAGTEQPDIDWAAPAKSMAKRNQLKQQNFATALEANRAGMKDELADYYNQENLALNQARADRETAFKAKELGLKESELKQRMAEKAKEMALKEKELSMKPNTSMEVATSDIDAIRARRIALEEQAKLAKNTGNIAEAENVNKQLNQLNERVKLEDTRKFYQDKLAVNPQDAASRTALSAIERKLASSKPITIKDAAAVQSLEKPRIDAYKLDKSQLEDITNFDNSIDTLNRIAAEKPGQDTGPISNIQNFLAQKAGIDDPQKSAFKAMVNDQVAQYIKSISGAAASDKERAFLMQNLPKVDDNDETFNAKLEAVKTKMNEMRQRYLENLSKAGKDITPYSKSNNSNTETRVINGKTYKKVAGGWEEQ